MVQSEIKTRHSENTSKSKTETLKKKWSQDQDDCDNSPVQKSHRWKWNLVLCLSATGDTNVTQRVRVWPLQWFMWRLRCGFFSFFFIFRATEKTKGPQAVIGRCGHGRVAVIDAATLGVRPWLAGEQNSDAATTWGAFRFATYDFCFSTPLCVWLHYISQGRRLESKGFPTGLHKSSQ